MVAAVLVALLVLHVMGWIDDRWGLSASGKLAVQLLVAAVLAVFFDMRVLQFLDGYGSVGVAASVVLSVLWMATITNAMNMLDNMDGLSGGVGAIIAALYLAACLIGGQWFVAALAAAVLGGLLGFLVFNFPPARVFMGDAGSLPLGLVLAILSIRTTYFESEAASPGGWYAVLMPLVVMAVPLYDLCSVVGIRLWQGRHPFSGDQQHFSHRLVRMGLSRPTAVMVIWLVTLATGIGGVILASVAPWQAAVIAVQVAAVLGILAILEQTGRSQEPGR